MRCLKTLFCLILSCVPCHGAISILVQRGNTSGTTIFTVTQTSANPLLNVSGISGYVSGMSLPTSMFDIPGFPGGSSDIYGDLNVPVATVTEIFSNQAFLINKLKVSADPSLPSLLGFDHVFTIPSLSSSVQFAAESVGPVEVNISFDALAPGIHQVQDTVFGTVTVTVVPEPAGILTAFSGLAAGLMIRRRRQ